MKNFMLSFSFIIFFFETRTEFAFSNSYSKDHFLKELWLTYKDQEDIEVNENTLYYHYNNKIEHDKPFDSKINTSTDWRTAVYEGAYKLPDDTYIDNNKIERFYQKKNSHKYDANIDPVGFKSKSFEGDIKYRIYLNPKAKDAEKVFGDAVKTFLIPEGNSKPSFERIKIFGRSDLHKRVDGIVMYGGGGDPDQVMNKLLDFATRNSSKLMKETPAGTIKLHGVNGVAFGPEPMTKNMSFGTALAKAIVDVIGSKDELTNEWVYNDKKIIDFDDFKDSINKALNKFLGFTDKCSYKIPNEL